MTTTIFDAADYIETEDDIVAFLDAACEGWDVDHIASALAVVARSQGMDEITSRTGVTRERLGVMLAANRPVTTAGLFDVLDALGLAVRIERKAA